MSQVHIIVDEYQDALGENPWYIPRFGYKDKDRANREIQKHHTIKLKQKKRKESEDKQIENYAGSHLMSIEILDL